MTREITNSKPTRKKNWNHIKFKEKDLPEIGLFFKALYSAAGDYGNMGFFHWKIIRNYIQPGIINLIKDKNRIVSTTSITPKLLVYRNEIINAAEIGDTYTHPDYWRQGMFSLLINQTRKDAEKKGMNFIYGTPNEFSLPGYQKKANFCTIENLHIRSLVFPIDINSLISKSSHWILGRFIGFISSIFLFLYFKIKNIFFLINKSIIIKEVTQVPDDWVEFWDRASQGFNFIINRNTEAIKWRYFESPSKYKFMILRKNKKLIGYLVFRIVHDDNNKNINIADYLTIPGEESSLTQGISQIISKAFKIGVHQVNLWCVEDSPYYKIFKKKGFFARGNVPVICYKNEFAERLKHCNSWHFTTGDSDNI